MRDTELYRQLVGLSTPWRVERVELKLEQWQVPVWVEHGEERWRWPEGGEPCPGVRPYRGKRGGAFGHEAGDGSAACTSGEDLVYRTWRAAGAAVLGRAEGSVHHPVRVLRHRSAAGARCGRSTTAPTDQPR